ncbi:hypothetical protein Cadr_000022483 [Camelus dromedarius]|uniref:Uncharacterized protein n=1 Tax=Camelus dromedarius TaxID=9838 RepID=A0A5N4CS87_CAMDR|nr:hypothetical protein Cadr_000022483 [Camelus dromedarius]
MISDTGPLLFLLSGSSGREGRVPREDEGRPEWGLLCRLPQPPPSWPSCTLSAQAISHQHLLFATTLRGTCVCVGGWVAGGHSSLPGFSQVTGCLLSARSASGP